jgi:hypothetical protein
MRKSLAAGALAVVLLFTLRAFSQKVTVDWDHNFTNFSSLHSYKLVKTSNTRMNPLMDQRIAAAIQGQLAAKGFREVESNPDVIVAYHTGMRRERSATYTGMGNWRMGGMGTISQNDQNAGTLVVDISNAHNRQLLWRGVASDTLSDNPDKNTKKIDKAVSKMFKKYPPKSK